MNKFISEKQAIKISAKFGVILNSDSFEKISHGDFLFKKVNEETGREIFYFLQRYFIQSYNKKYSCVKGGEVGKELIISNLPMLNIKNFL